MRGGGLWPGAPVSRVTRPSVLAMKLRARNLKMEDLGVCLDPEAPEDDAFYPTRNKVAML